MAHKTYIEFFILCLTTLFTLVNPLGITPVFIILTERFSAADRLAILKKALITAGTTLLVFGILGALIFRFYSITIEAFQIMGGIIFFRSGLRMLEAKVGRTRTTPLEQEESLEKEDIAISPIGIPLITGPGAITAAMLLSGQARGIPSHAILYLSILLVLAATYLILRGGVTLARRLGHTGLRIIQRIMGIILMVIAVQFVINGTTTVLKRIL